MCQDTGRNGRGSLRLGIDRESLGDAVREVADEVAPKGTQPSVRFHREGHEVEALVAAGKEEAPLIANRPSIVAELGLLGCSGRRPWFAADWVNNGDIHYQGLDAIWAPTVR